MERKKILYVITQDEWGGAQRYVFDLVSAQKQFEIVVAVGSPRTEYGLSQHIFDVKKQGSEYLENVSCITLNNLVRPVSLSHDWRAVNELKNLIIDFKPDIIHLNSSKASIIGSWAVKKIPKNSRSKVVYTVHGWVFNEPMSGLRRFFYRWLEKKTANYKDAIIVLSDADKKSGENLGLGKKLSLIPHGIESAGLLTRDEAISEILNEPFGSTVKTERPWFVTIANAYQTKGLDILITAIAQKKEKLSGINFFIIGDGPELNALKEMAEKFGLDNVYFCGFLPFAAGLLSAFDVFVLPSRKEGLPYALLEAIRARVPIIATRVGGILDLIEDKKSSLLVRPDSTHELADALCFAVENPEMMKKYAASASRPSSLKEMITKTNALYSALIPQATSL